MTFHHLDIYHITQTLGYIGLTFIIFAETGLFFGFFLPGDSLLFTAGLLAAKGFFNFYLLLIFLFLAAIIGYTLAYFIGLKLGGWLLNRKDNFFFKKKYLTEARYFYLHHGGKALILGRLLPVIRTFVPIVAGIAVLNFRKYTCYNLLGGLFWVIGMVTLGHSIGNAFPKAYDYIYPLIGLIIVVSLIPSFIHFFIARRTRKNTISVKNS